MGISINFYWIKGHQTIPHLSDLVEETQTRGEGGKVYCV